MWHAHDDLSAPELIERCVEMLDRFPDVFACHANTVIIGEHGERLRDHVEGLSLLALSPYRRLRGFVRHWRECPPVRRLLLADPARDHGEDATDRPYVNADVNFMSELALWGKFYELPQHLLFRRDHAGITTRKYANRKERIAWFDPTRADKGGGEGWLMLNAQLRAATVIPMGWTDRLRCYVLSGEFFLYLAQGSLRNWRESALQRLRRIGPGKAA